MVVFTDYVYIDIYTLYTSYYFPNTMGMTHLKTMVRASDLLLNFVLYDFLDPLQNCHLNSQVLVRLG